MLELTISLLALADLKSPNILLTQSKGRVIAKVADFGLSSRLFVDQLHGRPVENPTWWYAYDCDGLLFVVVVAAVAAA